MYYSLYNTSLNRAYNPDYAREEPKEHAKYVPAQKYVESKAVGN